MDICGEYMHLCIEEFTPQMIRNPQMVQPHKADGPEVAGFSLRGLTEGQISPS